MGRAGAQAVRTAREYGLAVCQSCGWLVQDAPARCDRCGRKVHFRNPASLQKVWAYWLAGVIAYIPGNTYPIMITKSVAGENAATIIGGVLTLIHHQSYLVAGVVFIASIVIPVSKFLVIAWLALSIQRGQATGEHTRLHAYEATEFIGRWSMVDVFVVAALAALIQLGALVSIQPGIGIQAFALSVIFTMLSANAFDARLIWDREQDKENDDDNL
ncbi:paraquat-inducible membrane protein A [Roseibium hamelinense]|nr:paraquat-inducible membrane protein A [Roseibium hamelinense]